ncbi:MAG: hypothetical protein FD143_2697 [Ignavibacteria bacterium]|nr:MAG: hypothetical protein FD143_2697 [Ignavibacteria bacterium]KAF0156056.1 MAG: hypothetical protein FD188_3041 [Ignavibacteria bacterium]
MKKSIYALLLVMSITNLLLAHERLVHQYIVREAYKLLKFYVGQDIYKMKDHIGYNEIGTGPFTPGGLVVIGAHREDEEDLTGEAAGFPNTTMNHFWNPNHTDNNGGFVNQYDPSGYEYANALEKAKKYFGGSWIEISGGGNRYRYQSLSQFYKDGMGCK